MKCKRAHLVYERDFIVVDDISGVWKMRSECKIDGYGFLSANGDPKHPQETPPIITENMAAWPDPRPRGIPQFTPEPNYVYFIFQYNIDLVGMLETTFDVYNSISLNGVLVNALWSVDGVDTGITGLKVTIPLTFGDHVIGVTLVDNYDNQQSFSFNYTQEAIDGQVVVGSELVTVGGAYVLSL